MGEGIEIALGLIVLALVFLATRYGIALRMQNVAKGILEDLQKRGATRRDLAVSLPYERVNYLHVGLRDYRPKVLASLVQEGYVGKTEEGKYFLQIPYPGKGMEKGGKAVLD